MATAKVDLTVVEVPVGSITPYWNNPRHSESAVDAVVASIERYGFSNPIILDGEHVIIAGHTRYRAAQRVGLDAIPAIIREDLSPEQARAFRIADNKAGEIATWDIDKLITELRTIPEVDDMQVFFHDFDLDQLLAETAGVGDSFDAPTQDDIDQAGEKAGSAFEERNRKELDGYVEMICPECGEEFHVQRDDVLARSDPGDEWKAMEFIIPAEMEPVWDAVIERFKHQLAEDGYKPHENRGVFRGQVLEALAADFLAGPE